MRAVEPFSNLKYAVAVENWPLAEAFVIARGAKIEARVVVVTLSDGQCVGRGECVPYARYGETVEGVVSTIHAALPSITNRVALQTALPAGAARNAIDCALWDIEAKRSGQRAHALAGLAELRPVETCFTLSLGTPASMAEKAKAVPHLKLLKLKLGGEGDGERMQAVRLARPDARLVADANESWTVPLIEPLLRAALAAGVELIEQPLPADHDGALADVTHWVPVCADESVHTTRDLKALRDRYDAVNIKLDKTGGLTEALAMANEARAADLKIMSGCMVATSLAMAPALILAQSADWVDLDGPLLLARDRENGLVFDAGMISPPGPLLWG
jgi:L-Ala-D/L-Glu epimerase